MAHAHAPPRQGVLAITWRHRTVGAAYFEPSSRTLFVMDDGRDVRHLDVVATSARSAPPSVAVRAVTARAGPGGAPRWRGGAVKLQAAPALILTSTGHDDAFLQALRQPHPGSGSCP